MADRDLARGAGRPRASAGTERQPGDQGVSAGDVSAGPARHHVLHRRPQGRLRADQVARRRVHDAAHARDGLDHRDPEGWLRQPHQARPAGRALNSTCGSTKEDTKMQGSKTNNVAFWTCTALVAFFMISGGLANILLLASIAGFIKLGYPAYFARILGAWKVLGGIAIL